MGLYSSHHATSLPLCIPSHCTVTVTSPIYPVIHICPASLSPSLDAPRHDFSLAHTLKLDIVYFDMSTDPTPDTTGQGPDMDTTPDMDKDFDTNPPEQGQTPKPNQIQFKDRHGHTKIRNRPHISRLNIRNDIMRELMLMARDRLEWSRTLPMEDPRRELMESHAMSILRISAASPIPPHRGTRKPGAPVDPATLSRMLGQIRADTKPV